MHVDDLTKLYCHCCDTHFDLPLAKESLTSVAHCLHSIQSQSTSHRIWQHQTVINHMSYKYSPLNGKKIRLLHLQPGVGTEALWADFEPASLNHQVVSSTKRLTLEQVEARIPEGWKVYETLERRYLFDHLWDNDDGDTTWVHPDPQIDPKGYQVDVPTDQDPPLEPYFEALSYAWGTDKASDVLHIGAKGPHQGVIPMRPNLAAALYQLRRRDDVRILWVDAVCIDQSNEEERNHQVALMTEIYRSATRVLVWLGVEDADSSLALETLDYLGAQVECCRSDTILRSPDCREKWWYRSGFDLQFKPSTWTAIHRLIERNWFERLWIWQEVHLANLRVTVHCGPKSVPFYNFRRGLICLREKQKLPSADLRTRLEFVDRLLRDRSGTDFPGLLSVTRLHKATNPKDRVYGILGLANFASLEIARMIKTDYTLDLENVYRDAFLAYLNQSGLLTLLRDCNLEQRHTTGATWVPDWSVPRNSNPLNYYFLASGSSRAVCHIYDKDRLIVTGVEVDKIVSVGAGFATQPDAFKASVIETVKSTEISTNIRQIPQDQVDACLITLCAGQIRETCPQIPAPTLPQCRTSYEALNSPGNPNPVLNDFYLRQVRFWSQGRVFFQSRKSIGLAPTGTEQGTYYALICLIVVIRSQH